MSLTRRLPLLICALLLGVVVLDSAASYRSVKNASLAVGRERLRSVTDQLADAFKASVMNTEKTLRAQASDSAYLDYLRSPSPRSRAAALAAMRKATPTSAQQRIVVELWSAQQALALTTADSSTAPHADAMRELGEASAGPRYLSIGRLRIERDTVVLPIVAAVLDGGKPIGYYLEWRRIAAPPKNRDQLLSLIGPNAALLIGNDSGNVWTDLATVVKAPRVDARAATDIVSYARADGSQVLGSERPIAGAPWVVVIELSQSAVLGAADVFLRRSAIIGLVLVAIGFLFAWSFSRSITGPLKHLTDASVAVASGDVAQTVDVSRADELGQLAAAFNAMAAQVRDTKLMLEERVRERTRRLEEIQVVMLRTERLNTLAMIGAGLAHDLNNLLFTISLAMQQLQADATDGKVARAELLGRIAAATTEATRLTKRLMSFARNENGAVEPTPVEITAAVASQEELLRMLLPRTIGLEVVVDAPKTHVMLPETLVEQALVNLVSNARDAMPSGGSVTVRLHEEKEKSSRRLLLDVTDTGHGIAPEMHGVIFETFFSTKAEKGTGIGLASVRALMESIGGTVSVHSGPGKGATFSLSFPLEA